jgi:hypothetical protein
MLDRLEKIEYSLGGLLVLAVAFLFFYPGLSATVSDVSAPPKSAGAQEFSKSLSTAAAAMHDSESKQADISSKGSGGATQPAKKEYYWVPDENVERLSDKRLVIDELDKAASKLGGKGRELTITSLKGESMLVNFGFQANDTIKTQNGKPIPFDDEGALWSLYNEQMDRFAKGEAVIITIERGGRPVQLHFAPEKLRQLMK